MAMPGRRYSATGSYRYGFNGKENDNEVKGEGNQQDYGMRIFDTRLGRFMSEDPITKKYPELTPYQFASNSPIAGIDEDGLEWAYYDKDNKQVNINSSTTSEDKLKITGVRWAGYDVDGKGNKTAKAGTVGTAFTFGIVGVNVSYVNSKGDGVQGWLSYGSLSTGDKTADKNIATLDPKVQNEMKKLVLMGRLRFGIDIRGANQGGFRTYAEQDKLYAKGRTAPGKIVTHAKGGQSNHNFGLAMDIAIYENGKYLTKGSEWQYSLMGKVGKTKIGLEWGGDWKLKKFDPAHHQNMQGYDLKQLQAMDKDANGYIIIK